MSTIPLDYEEPNGRIIQFPPECCQLPPVSDVEIGRMRGLEDRRLTQAAVDAFHGIERSDASSEPVEPPQADSCAHTTPDTSVTVVSTQPLTPFKPDVSANPRERAVDSALMDEIRQARSLLVDESEVVR
jgi:hypothetical protein